MRDSLAAVGIGLVFGVRLACAAVPEDPTQVEPIAVGASASTDRPALLYASLKEKVKGHILSDASMNAARAFSVAYRLDAKTLQYLKSEDIDLEATQGTKTHELPVLSVFIVDRSGIVRFRHFNADFKVRVDAASVLTAARNAQKP